MEAKGKEENKNFSMLSWKYLGDILMKISNEVKVIRYSSVELRDVRKFGSHKCMGGI